LEKTDPGELFKEHEPREGLDRWFFAPKLKTIGSKASMAVRVLTSFEGLLKNIWVSGREGLEAAPAAVFHKPGKIGQLPAMNEGDEEVEA